MFKIIYILVALLISSSAVAFPCYMSVESCRSLFGPNATQGKDETQFYTLVLRDSRGVVMLIKGINNIVPWSYMTGTAEVDYICNHLRREFSKLPDIKSVECVIE